MEIVIYLQFLIKIKKPLEKEELGKILLKSSICEDVKITEILRQFFFNIPYRKRLKKLYFSILSNLWQIFTIKNTHIILLRHKLCIIKYISAINAKILINI